MSRRSGNCVRCCLVVFAVVSALCVSGPAIYWKFKKSLSLKATSFNSCSPCVCDCAPPLSLLKIAPVVYLYLCGEGSLPAETLDQNFCSQYNSGQMLINSKI